MALVALATALGLLVRGHVAPTNLVMPYLLTVVISGLRWGTGPAVLASFLGVLAFDVFFVPPYLSLAVSHAEYIITFAALLVVALTIGTLTGQLREQTAALHRREQETTALYALSRSMLGAGQLHEIAEATVSHASASLGRPCAILLKTGGGRDERFLTRGAPLTALELEVAMWTMQHGKAAGWPETEHAGAAVGCVPVRAARGTLGALVVRFYTPEEPLTTETRTFMDALAAQAAVTAERTRLAEEAHQAKLLVEAEKLHDALLHSISHELRTPLASIIGSLSTVMDPAQVQLTDATRTELVQTAREEAERLNGLVGNLLDMTRLESGQLRLLVDRYDLADVIGAALAQADTKVSDHPVFVYCPNDMPLVPLDQVLIVQVLDNLLGNAAKYSPPGAPIDLSVSQEEGQVLVSVADRGIGIPEDEREQVFQKFYRVDRPGSPFGTGLGLAIAKGIVEAHRGRIWAEGRPGGGTVITFSLPLVQGRESIG